MKLTPSILNIVFPLAAQRALSIHTKLVVYTISIILQNKPINFKHHSKPIL